MQDNQTTSNVARLRELDDAINVALEVQETLETEGWTKTIEPLISKMIVDIVGGRQNGRFHNGSLDDKRLGEAKLQVLCAYKQALTDLHTYIYEYVDNLTNYKKEYNVLAKEEVEKREDMSWSEYEIPEE